MPVVDEDGPRIRQKPNTMYDNMTFKKVRYREYPKAIPVVGGKIMDSPYDARGKSHPVVIVASEAEEDALRGPGVTLVTTDVRVLDAPQRVETEDDIRRTLMRQADHLGAKVDGRWSIEKIEAAVQAAARKRASERGGESPEPM